MPKIQILRSLQPRLRLFIIMGTPCTVLHTCALHTLRGGGWSSTRRRPESLSLTSTALPTSCKHKPIETTSTASCGHIDMCALMMSPSNWVLMAFSPFIVGCRLLFWAVWRSRNDSSTAEERASRPSRLAASSQTSRGSS